MDPPSNQDGRVPRNEWYRTRQNTRRFPTAHLDPAAPEAGHAILCRVRVSGRGGAGLAPQQHEASYGFCTLAQRSKKHKHHNESLAPPLLDIREVTKACGESAREHLNGTLFDVTDMEKEELPEETDLIRHDDDNDDAEDPDSTGTARQSCQQFFSPMRGRMCARIVPMLRTCQASRHPSGSWRL